MMITITECVGNMQTPESSYMFQVTRVTTVCYDINRKVVLKYKS
jgi:hypothetical protein